MYCTAKQSVAAILPLFPRSPLAEAKRLFHLARMNMGHASMLGIVSARQCSEGLVGLLMKRSSRSASGATSQTACSTAAGFSTLPCKHAAPSSSGGIQFAGRTPQVVATAMLQREELEQPATIAGRRPRTRQQQQEEDEEVHMQQHQQHQHEQQQPQQQQGIRMLLLGIDPDSCGAVAAITADVLPHTSNSSSSSPESQGLPSKRSNRAAKARAASQDQQQQQLWRAQLDDTARVRLFDMPVQSVALKKPTKSGMQRTRRRLDVEGAINLVLQLLEDAQLHSPAVAGAAGDAAGGRSPPLLLRAFVEVASIVPSNGSLAILNQGYSVGAWSALLMALGFEVATVHVKTWKQQLGLLGLDKDSSRQLATQLYSSTGNCQQQLLSRKRDHGRAEALLIAAWGLGWSRPGDAGGLAGGLVPGPLRESVKMDGGMHVLALGQPLAQQLSEPAEAAAEDDEESGPANDTSSGSSSAGGVGCSRSGGVTRRRVLDVAEQAASAAAEREAQRAAKQRLKRPAGGARKRSGRQQAPAEAEAAVEEPAVVCAINTDGRAADSVVMTGGGSRRRKRNMST